LQHRSSICLKTNHKNSINADNKQLILWTFAIPKKSINFAYFKKITVMSEKTRYSDAELEEFRAIIMEKLEAAKRD